MPVPPEGIRDPASRIHAVINSLEPVFRDAFLDAVRILEDRNSLERLADLLERGAFVEALEALDEIGFELGRASGVALQRSAENAARFLAQSLSVTIDFDQTNLRAVNAIQNNSLRLITQFTNEQRASVRIALTEGITRGLNPRDQARLIRQSIGLTSNQMRAVSNFERLLQARENGLPSREVLTRALRDGRFDRSIQRAIRTNTPLTVDQITRMVDRYRARFINYRAEVIARTESLRSAHEGSELMYDQAMQQGEFTAEQLVRRWNTARDDRVRDTHQLLEGTTQPVGTPWVTVAGNALRFPGDPQAPASESVQCRCVISTRIRST